MEAFLGIYFIFLVFIALKDCVQQASRRLVGLNPVFCLMTTQD